MNAVAELPVLNAPKPVRATRSRAKVPARQIARPKRIADLVKAREIKMDVTWGLDPELFLASSSTGQIVSSIPVLKCSKHNPIKLTDGAKIYADNCLLEFSMPPAKTKQDLVTRMRKVFQDIQHTVGNDYRLVAQAAHTFDDSDLVAAHGVDPLVGGCEPSYNIYRMEVNQPPDFKGGLRSGSFHLHLGHKRLKDFKTRVSAIKLLDIYLGCANVIFDRDPTAAQRRAIYGSASEHRLPVWGAEYRVMGPYALRSPSLVELAIDVANHALVPLRQGYEADVIKTVDPVKVQHAINTCDPKVAKEVLTQAQMPAGLMERIEMDRGELDLYAEWDLKG